MIEQHDLHVGLEGKAMYALATELFPICRSITGSGVRQTLQILKRELPLLQTFEIESGTRCFDWTIPLEWNISDAYVIDPHGQKILDFKKNNLHVVGYSIPIEQTLSLQELQQHLYSLPEQPDAIPYVTSYYKEKWGFCLTHQQRLGLPEGTYRVNIQSSLTHGSLTYGELLIPGESDSEIFLSTYVCHPSMANNELSGPVVQTQLAKWIQSLPKRRHSYRLIFVPETIGSIAYISRHFEALKSKLIAGFNITCVGDDRCFSYLPSRKGQTLSDRVALHVLRHFSPSFISYSFLERGSDERQYCSPGVDLPVASIMRSKYGAYPEYHTSLDNMDLITPNGLQGSYDALRLSLECIEKNWFYKNIFPCEPQLGKRGLYPLVSTKTSALEVTAMMDMLAYCDGSISLLEVAELIHQPMWKLVPIAENLVKHGVLENYQSN